MKVPALAAFLSATTPLLAGVAGLPVTEDLNNPGGEGVDWFSNHSNTGLGDFFERVTVAQPLGFAAPIGGFDGTMWAMEDVDGIGSVGVWTMKTIPGAGAYTDRQVTVQFATVRTDGRFEQGNDNILIQYAVDDGIAESGVPGSGSYVTIGRLVGDDFPGVSGGQLRKDTDLDGSSSAAEGGQVVDGFLTPFVFQIPNGGTNLSIRIVADIDGGSEEVAFDEVTISGTIATTNPPVLAGIEPGSLSYTEGASATQVTSSLAVTDSDSNIDSATVTVMSGFVPGEDVLAFTPSGGITGGFVGSVLSLSGSASPAAYQTVLRSVTYVNTNGSNPNVQPRTITFQVNDGSDPSNSQSRQINSVAVLPLGSIPHTESFETNGESLTYLSNSHDAGADHFYRFDFGSNGGAHPEHGGTVLGVDGSWAWAGEDVDSASNPLGETRPGVILIQDLDSNGFNGLEVTVSLGSNPEGTSGFEPDDVILVQYAFGAAGTDGTDLLGGSYTTVGSFTGGGPLDSGLRPTLTATGASNQPDGTVITNGMQDFTFTIPSTGSSLSIRILDDIDGGSEEHVIDNIRITGVFGPLNDPPQLAAVESSPIAYNEGDPAVSITGTLTVSDTDDTDLEGATVKVIGGFDATEDQLLFSNQNGISGSFVGDTLTLTGTSSVANYQAALRSVQYLNSDLLDASPATRTFRFTANDGTANGNFQDRSLSVSPSLNAAESITSAGVCESFETDGEGTRYASSNGNTGDDYFARVAAASPPSGYVGGPIAGPGLDGAFAWAAEDPTSLVGGEAVLLLAPYSVTGFTGLNVSIALENPRFDDLDQWDATDGLAVDVSIDGGAFATIANFRGDNATPGVGGQLRQDLNLNGASNDLDGGAIVPAEMTNYSFPLAATGDTIQVRVRFFGSGSEELAFDNICITGTDGTPPTVALANPANGSSLTASALNAQGYIDVTFEDNDSIVPGSITDGAAEFFLEGAAAAGVIVNGAGSLVSGTTYRYTFTGGFGFGAVGVNFQAGSFSDPSTNVNLAGAEGFTVLNSPPTLVTDTIERYPTQSAKATVAFLLSNDSDPDMNGPLTITGVSSPTTNGGTVTLSGDWVFYTPAPGYVGDDSFTYTAQDNLGAASEGTVNVTITVDNAGATNITVQSPPSGTGGPPITLTIVGIPNRTYTIQKMDESDAGVWQVLGTVTADALGRMTYVDPGPLPDTRLYRTVFP